MRHNPSDQASYVSGSGKMQLCCSISRTGFQLKGACPLLPVVEHTNPAPPLGTHGLPGCPPVKGLTWLQQQASRSLFQ